MVFQLDDEPIPGVDISSSSTSSIALVPRFSNQIKRDHDLSNFKPSTNAVFLTQEIKKASTMFTNTLAAQHLDPTTTISNGLEKRIGSVENAIGEFRDTLSNIENNIEKVFVAT